VFDSARGVALVEKCQNGIIDPAHYRGRLGWPAEAQAGELQARQDFDNWDMNATRLVKCHFQGDNRAEVHLEVAGQPWRCMVTTRPSDKPYLVACSGEIEHFTQFEVTRISPAARESEPRLPRPRVGVEPTEVPRGAASRG